MAKNVCLCPVYTNPLNNKIMGFLYFLLIGAIRAILFLEQLKLVLIRVICGKKRMPMPCLY